MNRIANLVMFVVSLSVESELGWVLVQWRVSRNYGVRVEQKRVAHDQHFRMLTVAERIFCACAEVQPFSIPAYMYHKTIQSSIQLEPERQIRPSSNFAIAAKPSSKMCGSTFSLVPCHTRIILTARLWLTCLHSESKWSKTAIRALQSDSSLSFG